MTGWFGDVKMVTECPHCGLSFSERPGDQSCPFCGKELEARYGYEN